MLEKGDMKQSTSPWVPPVVPAQMKDEMMHLCVDYHKINNITHKDAYPFLCVLSGYWQVEVEEDDCTM